MPIEISKASVSSRCALRDSRASIAGLGWPARHSHLEVRFGGSGPCARCCSRSIPQETAGLCTGFETSVAHLRRYMSSFGALEWASVNHFCEKTLVTAPARHRIRGPTGWSRFNGGLVVLKKARYCLETSAVPIAKDTNCAMVSFSIEHFFHKDLLLYLCIGCFVLPSIGGQLALSVHFYSLPVVLTLWLSSGGNRTSGRIHGPPFYNALVKALICYHLCTCP